jgi:hypothetical protein
MHRINIINRYKTSINYFNITIKKRYISNLSLESEILNIEENDISDRNFSQTKLASELIQRGRDIIPNDQLYSNSMEEYITLRKFKKDNLDTKYNNSANRILSAALTFPLTLSYALSNIFPYGLPSSSSLNPTKILIVGARSESSLPKIWWKDLLICENNNNSSNSSNNNNKRLLIDFLGPDLLINQLNNKNINENIIFNSNLDKFNHMIEFKELNLSNKICLHKHNDYLSILKEYDVFVMYNPGLGSIPLKGKWDDTLRLLMSTRKPIICTAHSSGNLSISLYISLSIYLTPLSIIR